MSGHERAWIAVGAVKPALVKSASTLGSNGDAANVANSGPVKTSGVGSAVARGFLASGASAGGAARGLTEEELLGVLQARLAFGRIIAMHCHPPTLYQTH
jgi:hypothetical protein